MYSKVCISKSVYCSCEVFLAFRPTCSHLKFIFYLMVFDSVSHAQSYCKLNVFGHNDKDEIYQFLVKWTFLWEAIFLFFNCFEFLFI